MTSDEQILEQTNHWLRSFIIKLNICPFAKREIEKNTLKTQICSAKKIQEALEELLIELIFLDKNTSVETTLLIFPSLFKDFLSYLDFVDYAERLIQQEGYEGLYQIATFHPDYCFEGEKFDDPANYTNRSPYPMLHLLREASVEKAIAYYGDTEAIPKRNLATLRELGVKKIKELNSLKNE